MQTTLKIIELLSKKYLSNISILGTYQSSKYISIVDSNNGTMFIISDNHLFSFKDQHCNLWLTILKSFYLNENEHNMKPDKFYTKSSGIKYSFTSKEKIVAMAVKYFEQHKCPNS